MNYKSKVLLHGYKATNLGDDLFYKYILERYRNTLFIMIAPQEYKTYFSLYNNLIVINNNSLFIRLLYKIETIFGFNHIFSSSFLLNIYLSIRYKFNVILTIGGSIFMEGEDNGQNLRFEFKVLKKIFRNSKFLILGCNFGPYKTMNFKSSISSIIEIVDDICFRDKISFDYFSHLKNVRYGNDIVLHYKYSKNIKPSKIVGISLISFDKRKSLYPYKDAYIRKNIEIINLYRNLGYKIILISFCEKEGDKNIINEIMRQFEFQTDISTLFYDGNINNTLDIIKSLEIIIATRFHAIILGLLFGIKVLPIAYNNKAKDLLITFNLWKDEYELTNFVNCKIDNLQNLIIFNYQIDFSKNNQFDKLDRILLCTNCEVSIPEI